MRTSYSALNTYKTCSLKYKYSQIDKIKEPKRIEAVFGTLIHSALKFMFERNPVYPTLDEVIDFYTQKWSEKSEKVQWRNPDKKETEEKMFFEEGIKILKNFYKKNQPWTFDVVELEGRFSFDLLDDASGQIHTIAGIIDRIDKDPNSEVYEIIDYKTGKKMPSQEMLDEDLQLGVYHLALSSRWPHVSPENIKTSLYFLKHNEKISTTKAEEMVEKAKRQILNTIAEIEERTEKDDFPPMSGPLCGWCGFRNICPMWAHEYKSEEPPTKTEEEIAEVIKEFFEIKEDEDINKKRLKELRGDILSYMEANDLARVFGAPGYITKNASERTSFDMEKIKPILVSVGKLEQILVMDDKKLESLLPYLSTNIQKQILETREKKTVVTLKQTKKKS